MAGLKDIMIPIKAVGFRSIVNKIICIECRDLIEEMFGADVDKKMNCLIGYCYIDHERGLSFQPGVAARVEGDEMQLMDLPNYSIMYVIRVTDEKLRNTYEIGGNRMESYSVSPENYWFAVSAIIDDMSMFDGFIKRFDNYLPTKDVAEMRANRELDAFRNEFYPDDVIVCLYKEGKIIEKVWVRCEFVTDRCMFGLLLNEPYGDLGYHKDEMIGFEIVGKDEKALFANGLKAEIANN